MGKYSDPMIVRDMRGKDKFYVDDKYLNGWARRCGPFATLVYLSLCRHVDRNQECFPSQILMAEKLAISKNSVIRGLKILESYGIIRIEKRVHEHSKRQLPNVYVLLDKSQWVETPSRVPHRDSEPGAPQSKSRVPPRDCKDTQFKDNISQESEKSQKPSPEETICGPTPEWEQLKKNLRPRP